MRSTSATCWTWRVRPESSWRRGLVLNTMPTWRCAWRWRTWCRQSERRRVSPEMQKAHPDIPWRNIVGVRHKVVHDYFYVDYDIIWDVVTNDLPGLMIKLEPIVGPDQT